MQEDVVRDANTYCECEKWERNVALQRHLVAKMKTNWGGVCSGLPHSSYEGWTNIETLSPVRGQGSGFSRTEQSQTPLPGTQCPSTAWLCGYFDESSSKSPLYLDMATPNSLTSPPSPNSAQNRMKHLLTDLFLHYELGSVSHFKNTHVTCPHATQLMVRPGSQSSNVRSR